MNDSVEQIWKKTLLKIKDDPDITNLSFGNWFAQLKPLKYIYDTFYVLADNQFVKSTIEARPIYTEALENSLSAMVNEACKVSIVLSPEEVPKVVEVKKQGGESQNGGAMVTYLNPRYTFDTFVVGENNRFAHAACMAVSENPSEKYNPLFIYGGVGLGKTHLLQAIGHYTLVNDPSKKVVYVSCEKFTNDFIDSIQNKTNIAFRNKYRKVDILLIDDIQFLAGKEGTQIEFFHTFNALYNDNKQIVITSDRPPREIQELEERLRSRFEMGLTPDISAPNFETRLAIIKKKAESHKENIPNEVFHLIADNIHSNIRELEGALTTIVAYTKLHNKPINLESATEAMREILKNRENPIIDVDYIKEVTSRYFNITMEEIDSKKRTKTITLPRHTAMYLTRELTDLSLPKIGDAFGGRDHSTVINACKKVQEEMKNNSDYNNLIIRIKKELQ